MVIPGLGHITFVNVVSRCGIIDITGGPRLASLPDPRLELPVGSITLNARWWRRSTAPYAGDVIAAIAGHR